MKWKREGVWYLYDDQGSALAYVWSRHKGGWDWNVIGRRGAVTKCGHERYIKDAKGAVEKALEPKR